MTCGTKDTDPLVSVIVPYYNLEDCVDYNLSSLLSQSFDSYEILCVDDGSTDSTGVLLDVYASSCSRIHVLHTSNCGQGAARNTGVKHAKGRYLTFVDGDDIVSPSYIESLVNTMPDTLNCFVLTGHVLLSQHDIESHRIEWPNESSWTECSKQVIIEKLLYEDLITSPWGRLAPKWLYEKFPFPEMQYEDIAIAADHILAFHSFRIASPCLYGYVKRKGSTVRGGGACLKKAIDYQIALDRELSAFSSVPGISKEGINYKKALEESRIYKVLSRIEPRNDEVTEMKKRIVKDIRKSLHGILQNKRVGRLNKCRFVILAKMPALFGSFFMLYDLYSTTRLASVLDRVSFRASSR